MRLLLVLLLALGFVPGTVFAQADVSTADTSTASETTLLATETELNEADFELSEPSSWEFFKRRFVHFFTFNQTKRLRQELDLANLTLFAAKQAEADGNTERAAELMETFTVEMARISDAVSELAGSITTDSNDTVFQALIARIQEDRLLQASTLEHFSATTQAELQSKALKARADALRDVAKLLTADDPSPKKFQERLARIADKLAEREAKLERKIAKRLATFEAVDTEIDEPELEDALDEVETDELNEVATLDETSLGEVVREIQGSLGKHLLVLQALLDRLPTESRDTVETVLEREVEQLKTLLETDREALKRLFDEDHESELHDKVLERLNKETEQVAEAVKDAIEDQREQTKQILEKERERAKKAAEAKKTETEEDEDTDEDSKEEETESESDSSDSDDQTPSTSSSTPSTSTTSGGSSSSGSGSSGSSSGNQTTEVKTETKEIEIEDGQFKTTSFETKKGTRLTVKLKNKDSVAHDFSLVGSSSSTGSVSPDSEKSVTFDVSGNLEFYCSLHPSATHGTIVAK